MKKLNIAATGYYGSTESWKWVASAYEMIAEVLGKLVHPNDPVIITGVEVSGTDVSDGFISYGGELFFFKGGAKTDTVVIIEDITEQEYNTGASGTGTMPTYPTYIDRYAKCGQPGEGVAEFDFDDLVRIETLKTVNELLKPATENKSGIIEIATNSETNAGVDNTRAVTPAGLKYTLNNSTFGVVDSFEITNVNVQDGSIYSTNENFTLTTPLANYIVLASLVNQNSQSPGPTQFSFYISSKTSTGFDLTWVIETGQESVNDAIIQVIVMKIP